MPKVLGLLNSQRISFLVGNSIFGHLFQLFSNELLSVP